VSELNEATILVVDDDRSTLLIAVLLLRRAGYIVWTAESGEEALELVRTRGNISLLLADVMMPGLSGPELAAGVVHLRKDVRVLLMSDSTPDQLELYWTAASGYPLLPKPG